MTDRLLTKKEVAKFLGLTERTITSYVQERKIPYIRMYGSVRFNSRQLEQWIENKTVTPVKLA